MKLLGVAKWSGWGLSYSDGMCNGCSARARAEWSLPAAAPNPAPRWKPPSLKPDFAFATGTLLVTAGVVFGLVIGPPPRTVWVPTDPATSVATDDRRASDPDPGGADGPAVRDGVHATAAGAPDRASGATSQRADAVTFADDGRRPVRVVRASAKRPARVTYQPALLHSAEPTGPPASHAHDAEEISPLDRVPQQAP